jgi:hypothetical protein
VSNDRIRELATKYRRAMISLGATDADFAACGVEPPSAEERAAVMDLKRSNTHEEGEQK